jgi:hypothetical protein
MKISTQDITYLAIDSLNFYHDGINWARDRNCSDVLFNPPYYYTSDTPELLLNANFTSDFSNWQLSYGGGNVPVIENGRVKMNSSEGLYPTYYAVLSQYFPNDNPTALPAGQYTIKINCSVPSGLTGMAPFPFDVPSPPVIGVYAIGQSSGTNLGFGVYDTKGDSQIFSADFDFTADPYYEGFYIYVYATGSKGPIYIDSVSLKSRKQINTIHHWDYYEGLGVGSIEQGQIGDIGFD